METIDIRYACFECKKVKRQVIVNSIVLPAGDGEAMDVAVDQDVAFDCNQKKDCGVLTEMGGKISVDWSECVCSDLQDHLPQQIERDAQPTGTAAALQTYYSLMVKPKRRSGSQHISSPNPETGHPG